MFSSSVTAFVSQTIIGGGRMVLLPFYIWQQATTLFNWPFAAAISIVLLLSVLTVVVVLNCARPAQPRLCACLGGRARRRSPTAWSSAG